MGLFRSGWVRAPVGLGQENGQREILSEHPGFFFFFFI